MKILKNKKKINNFKLLEELSCNFQDIFNKFKNLLEEINKNKEEIKIEIQKIFGT